MLSNVGFEIVIASMPEYEKVIAEIYCDGKFVAAVLNERGREKFEIEFAGTGLVEDLVVRRVDARGFMEAVERAIKFFRDG